MKAFLMAAALAASTTACALQAPLHAAEPAPMTTHPIPRLVQQDSRYALMVDGAPYLMLSAQSIAHLLGAVRA